MYNGIINIDNLDKNEILELLEACDELCFDELIDDLQNFLIKEEKEWIQENLIHTHKISSKLYLKSKLKSKSQNISTLGPWSKLKVEMILDSRNS